VGENGTGLVDSYRIDSENNAKVMIESCHTLYFNNYLSNTRHEVIEELLSDPVVTKAIGSARFLVEIHNIGVLISLIISPVGNLSERKTSFNVPKYCCLPNQVGDNY
jgi:hypothetical protein